MCVGNTRGIVRYDPDALRRAKRWANVSAVLFAIGAVSGTVLSFEMGLLWPGLMGRFGDVLGLPFALERLSFFVEGDLPWHLPLRLGSDAAATPSATEASN
jgi:cytochrome bd ubiquinol oxidase subunit I